MPRPLVRRSLDEKALARQAEAADDPIPHGEETLRALLEALLHRIATKNPYEGRWLRGLVQQMRVVELDEALSSAPIKAALMRAYLQRRLLQVIRAGKRPIGRHDLNTLQGQDFLLRHYLHAYFYPSKDARQQVSWITKHDEDIRHVLTMLPCRCRYTVTPITPEQLHKARVDAGAVNLRAGDAVLFILGRLHNNVLPGRIKKLLTSTQTPART
jgi:hypothetical protein